jgi:hypothetical protein
LTSVAVGHVKLVIYSGKTTSMLGNRSKLTSVGCVSMFTGDSRLCSDSFFWHPKT